VYPDQYLRDVQYDDFGRLQSYTDSHYWVEQVWVCNDPQIPWCPDDGYWDYIAHNDPIRSDTYTYDDAGNRTDRGAIVNGNWVTSFDGFTLTYDDDGNITHKVKPGLTDQYFTWNSLGQLTQATVNGVVTTYGYDGFGRRVRKTANGVTTRYLWDGDNLVVEMDANGNPIREYSYYPGIDRPHAVRRSSDGAVFYYITETPGHVVGLVNSSNQVVNSYEYEPFGVTLAQTEQVVQPFKYSAREQDTERGLYFMRARYYDPQLARFLSEDPIGLAGGINPFAYVGNDPVNATDPYGLFECEWITGQVTVSYFLSISVIGYMFPICWGGESPAGRVPEPPPGFTPLGPPPRGGRTRTAGWTRPTIASNIASRRNQPIREASLAIGSPALGAATPSQ
jgi:RHS repeat-associated protein